MRCRPVLLLGVAVSGALWLYSSTEKSPGSSFRPRFLDATLARAEKAWGALVHIEQGLTLAASPGYFQHTLLLMSAENVRGVREAQTLLIKDTAALLDEHSVRWSICCGTLLGFMRTGDSFGIPWDDDVDIRVHRDDWEKLHGHVLAGVAGSESGRMGALRFDLQDGNGTDFDLQITAPGVGIERGEGDTVHLDLVSAEYHARLPWRDQQSELFTVPTRTIVLAGVRVQAPPEAEAEMSLQAHYGKGWRSPPGEGERHKWSPAKAEAKRAAAAAAAAAVKDVRST